MNCKQNPEQLVPYLAGVLEPADEQAIEAHLQAGCPRCVSGLADARRLLDELPLALEPAEPRLEVRQRLLEQVEQVATESAPSNSETPLRFPGQGANGVARSPWSIVRMVGACAAAAALAAGATFAWMDLKIERQADEVAQLRQQVVAYDQQLAEHNSRTMRQQRLADIASELYAVLRSSPLEMVRMSGVDEFANTSARLIWDRSRNVGHFLGPENFQPEKGRRLKLWLVSGDDEARLAGTFALDEFGWARFDIGMTEAEPVSFHSAYISYDDADTPGQVLLSGNF